MRTHRLVLSWFTTGMLIGCAGSGGSPTTGGDTGGGDNTGGDAGGGPGPGGGGLPSASGVSTLAGAGDPGYVDGAGKDARFANPVNVAYRDGVLYVADFDNGKLRAIDTATHTTTTVIGQPGFSRPFGMTFAGDGTLYVSTDNDRAGKHSAMSGTIWKVDVAAHTATVVAEGIGRPRGIAALPDGRIAVVDYVHHVVEVVDARTGRITLIAGAWDAPGMADGPGTTARFSAPYGVAVRDGKLLVSDHGNSRIRLVGLDGMTTTLSGASGPGFADGALDVARFEEPQGLSVAASGDVFITDTGNFRVRRIAGNRVETIAGNGVGGWIDSNDPLAAELYGLEGLSVVPDGSMVYVADGDRGTPVSYNRVRQIELP